MFNVSSIILVLLIIYNNNYIICETPDSWFQIQREQRKIQIGESDSNIYCHLLKSNCLETLNPSDGTSNLNSGEDKRYSEMASRQILNVEFEVYGKVQGVFFRKNTVEQGKKLKLRGWCMNTSDGTVKGVMEGEPERVKEMKHWLSHVGSKMSRIDKAEFRNEKTLVSHSFKDFSVRY